jgi:hypothetical protein
MYATIGRQESVDVGLERLEGGREDRLGDGKVDGAREVEVFLPEEGDGSAKLGEGDSFVGALDDGFGLF